MLASNLVLYLSILGDSEWMHGHSLCLATGRFSQEFTVPREIWKAQAFEISQQECQHHRQWSPKRCHFNTWA